MKNFNRNKVPEIEPTFEQIQKEEKYKFLNRKTKSQSSNSLYIKKNIKNSIESNDYSFYHGKMIKPPKEKKTLVTSTSQSSLKIPEYIHIHSLDKKSKNKDDAVKHIKNIAHSLNQYKYLYRSSNKNKNDELQNQNNGNVTTLPSLNIKNSKKKDKISITKEIEKKQSIKNLSMADDSEDVNLSMAVKNPMVSKLPPLSKSSSTINIENQLIENNINMEMEENSKLTEKESEAVKEIKSEEKNDILKENESENTINGNYL